MRTIEAVRLENFGRLLKEIRGDGPEPAAAHVAAALGISGVYAWQLMTGKRTNIDSKAARLMERKAEKPEGWLDTDFELWPFPDASLLAAVEQLNAMERAEVQGAIRDKLSQFGKLQPTPPPFTVGLEGKFPRNTLPQQLLAKTPKRRRN